MSILTKAVKLGVLKKVIARSEQRHRKPILRELIQGDGKEKT